MGPPQLNSHRAGERGRGLRSCLVQAPLWREKQPCRARPGLTPVQPHPHSRHWPAPSMPEWTALEWTALHSLLTSPAQDQVMQQIGDEWVSFVFSLQVDGRPVDPEPPLAPLAQQPSGTGMAGHARRAGGVRPALATGAPAGGEMKRPAVAQVAARQQTAAAPPPAPAPAATMPAAPAPAAVFKENAASNAAAAVAGQRAGSRLALPQRPKPMAAAAAAKPAPQRAAVVISDSEDDFK